MYANLLVSQDEVKDWLPNGAQQVSLQSHMGRTVTRGQLCAMGIQLQPLVCLFESLGNAITFPPPSLPHDTSYLHAIHTQPPRMWAASRVQYIRGEFRMAGRLSRERVF